jgi:hypothetical protein
MFNIDWQKLLDTLKEISSVRFYFIVTLSFFLILANIYREPLTSAVKETSFTSAKFRECRDLEGLEVALDDINKRNEFINSYTVYMYQPLSRPYYKKMLISNSVLVKKISTLQGSLIQDQPTFNRLLAKEDYFILEADSPTDDTQFMKDLNIDYLLVYRVYDKGMIGEIVLILTRKPTDQELKKLLKDLSPLVYEYVI